MRNEISQYLIDLNRRFYDDFGKQFSATRQRIQPGVRQIIHHLSGNEAILDLGCGNGEFARELAQTDFQGTYTGLDFSIPLLSDAKEQKETFPAIFFEADLASSDWDLPFSDGQFSLITSFAFMHHIPDDEIRRKILRKVHRLLKPINTARYIQSSWQFMNSPKLANRVQPWEKVNLQKDDLDPGDYLLDWKSGGDGLRYVHLFSIQELEKMAAETGFIILDSFYSDGENNRLGLYQTWERNEN